jgi:hypothetical protein
MEFKRRRSKPLRFRRVPLADEHPDWLELNCQLPPDHLARRIRALVEGLDFSPVFETYSGVGSAIIPPELLLAFVLFEMQRKRLSPADWFSDSLDQSLPARWLLRGFLPARSVFYRFRDHLPPDLVDSLNRQILLLAVAEGHTTAGNASLDGTFTAAYGSRHRLLNEQTLSHRLKLLDEAIAVAEPSAGETPVAACPARLTPPGTAGQAAPAPCPATPPLPLPDLSAAANQATALPAPQLAAKAQPYWMASTRLGRQRQRERYQVAEKTLKTRLIDHAEKQKGKSIAKRKGADKVVISPTEPEAVLGKDKFKVFRPLYNTQIAQDLDSGFVLGYGVYARVTDSGLLPPMVERTQALTGQKIKKVLSDGIYASLSSVRYCKENGLQLYAPVEADRSGKSKESGGQGKASTAEKSGGGKKPEKKMGKEQFKWEEELRTYRCPQGHLLQPGRIRSREREEGEIVQSEEYRCAKEHCMKCPQAKRCTSRPEEGRTVERMQEQELLDEVAARMRTEEGKQQYKKRKQTVELRHGDMRTHRGLTHFHGYGQNQGHSQVGLLVLAHNGLTLFQVRKQRKAKPTTPERPKQTDDKDWLSFN